MAEGSRECKADWVKYSWQDRLPLALKMFEEKNADADGSDEKNELLESVTKKFKLLMSNAPDEDEDEELEWTEEDLVLLDQLKNDLALLVASADIPPLPSPAERPAWKTGKSNKRKSGQS